MPEGTDAQDILRQNLLDAGCCPDTVRQCMDLAEGKDRTELLRILSCHRRKLLDALHQNEKCIDCLDYLIYQLKKNGNEAEEGFPWRKN